MVLTLLTPNLGKIHDNEKLRAPGKLKHNTNKCSVPNEKQRLATGMAVLVRKPMDDDTPTGCKLTSCYSSTKKWEEAQAL